MMDLSKIKIVLPKDGGACINYASQELADFIEKSCGFKPEITTDNVDCNFISLGKTKLLAMVDFNINYNSFKDDGFFIKEKDGNIYIDGKIERSVLYGVYDFLEVYLGIRFISHDYTYIPKNRGVIEQAIDRLENPVVDYRSYSLNSTFGPTVKQDYMARVRSYNNFTVLDEKYGQDDIFYARARGTHNCVYFVKEEYNETHPEFFVYDPNNRGDDLVGFYHDRMLCLTNGITEDGEIDQTMDVSVAKLVVEEMIKDFIAHPEAKYFAFDQMDGFIKCNCPKCLEAEKKYRRSGILVRFCNAIIREVQKYSDEHLGGRKFILSTLAYSYAREAPVIELDDGTKSPIDKTVVPHKNLAIRLCVNFNGLYAYNSNRQVKSEYDLLADWSRITEYLLFWGYDSGFDCLLKWFPSYKNIGENVRYLVKRDNIKLAFINGAYQNDDWQHMMRAYAYNKLLWNPSLNSDELVEEFNYHYFGETAYPYVKEFVDKIQTRCEWAGNIYAINFRLLSAYKFPQVVDLETIDACQALVEKAIQEVEKTETGAIKDLHIKHLYKVYVMPLFYKLMDYKYFYPESTEDEYFALAKDWVKYCEIGDIEYYHNDFSVKSFVDSGYKFPY